MGGKGPRGVPKLFFLLESLYLSYLGAHAQIWNPTTTPSAILVTVGVESGYMAVEFGFMLVESGYMAVESEYRLYQK